MRTFQVLQQLFASNNKTFINGLFREFLNTKPFPKDLAYFTSCLESGNKSRDEILKIIIMSEEFKQLFLQPLRLIQILQEIMYKKEYEFVSQLHSHMFGQYSKLRHIQQDIEFLRAGITKAEILKKHLLNLQVLKQIPQEKIEQYNNSQINIQKILNDIFKKDNNTFLILLYKELLDRNPNDNELKTFTKALDSGLPKAEIFKILIKTPEFNELVQKASYQSRMQIFRRLIKTDEKNFITELYHECHGREPDLNGFQHFIHLLKLGTPKLDILRTILLSEEALNRFHTLCSNDKKTISIPSELWPHVRISTSFREKVKKILKANKLPYKTNILVKTGGLGDFIQITAVAKALKIKEPEYPVVAIINQYGSLYDEHPYIDLAIECGPMETHQVVKSILGLSENVFDLRYISRAYGTWKNSDYYYKNLWYYEYFPRSGIRIDDLNKHVCDLMLHSLGLEKYANCNDVYIKPDIMIEKIPGDYVVLSSNAGSVAGQLKHWSKDEWNKLIKWLHSQGVIPIQLGLSTDSLLNSSVMDLRGKTTPRQAAGYLKFSKGYIGIEGGLFHLAKAVGTPAVVIFASTSETCFAYPDTYVVTKKLCRPCWWNEPWLQAKCLRGNKTCLNLPNWEDVAYEVSKMLRGDN
ncbi:DUF4214 domain-containing protein [Crassaminicella thermophila]|uniref:DUF4214 domain-containing protein n=1 Tax=Crassaminicella thermophila TaxID=2599308 RepID=A0A5C0SHI6_CRATE|nr:DUF4214 domain-containing protein [Crassaminicella thermophila]QEK12884.1 DUF4214 domain-containing protein [Crassaminicella thermophila]